MNALTRFLARRAWQLIFISQALGVFVALPASAVKFMGAKQEPHRFVVHNVHAERAFVTFSGRHVESAGPAEHVGTPADFQSKACYLSQRIQSGGPLTITTTNETNT